MFAGTNKALACSCVGTFIDPDLIGYSILAFYDDLKACAQKAKTEEVQINFSIDGAIKVTSTKPKALATCAQQKTNGFHTKGILAASTKAVLRFEPANPRRQFNIAIDYMSRGQKLVFDISNEPAGDSPKPRINGFKNGTIKLSLASVKGEPVIEYTVPKESVGKTLTVRGCRTDDRITPDIRGHFLAGSIEQMRWCVKEQPKDKKAECAPSYLNCIHSACIDTSVKIESVKGTVGVDKGIDLVNNYYDFVGFVLDQRISSDVFAPEKIAAPRTPVEVNMPPLCDCESDLFPALKPPQKGCS